MAYIPLARKYRPSTFDELIGQAHVTQTLQRSLDQKRVAQAYLFAGLRGVGKTSAARILAKCFNCEKGPTAVPCNTCTNCVQIAGGSSLDVMEIDGASNRGIDEIRSLRETVPYAPAHGRFHVYIIDEVHMLTTEAFNALLKTLEEPPEHVKFIFATTEPSKVPATVLSRCQRFDFRRIEVPEMVEILKRVAKKEKIEIDEAALFAVARSSEGSVRDAEVVLDQLGSFVEGNVTEAHVTELLGAIGTEALFALAQAILDRNVSQALQLVMAQREQSKDPAELLVGLMRHLRNLLMVSSVQGTHETESDIHRLVDEPADRLQRLQQQVAQSTTQELLFMLQMLTGAYDVLRRSPMPHVVLELVVIKLATREQWQSLQEINHRLEQLSSSAGRAPRPASSAPSEGRRVPRRVPDAAPSMLDAVRGVMAATQPAKSPAPGKSAPKPKAEISELVGDFVEEEAPPQAVAAPSAPLVQGNAELVHVWPEFIARVAQSKGSLGGYLNDSVPLRFEEGIVAIGLPTFALHQEALTQRENHRLIEQLLGELCRATVKVRFETIPSSQQQLKAGKKPEVIPVDTSAPAIVRDIVRLFNATALEHPPSS